MLFLYFHITSLLLLLLFEYYHCLCYSLLLYYNPLSVVTSLLLYYIFSFTVSVYYKNSDLKVFGGPYLPFLDFPSQMCFTFFWEIFLNTCVD